MPYPKGRHGRSKWGRRRKFRRDGPSLDLGNERTRKGTARCVESALAQLAKRIVTTAL